MTAHWFDCGPWPWTHPPQWGPGPGPGPGPKPKPGPGPGPGLAPNGEGGAVSESGPWGPHDHPWPPGRPHPCRDVSFTEKMSAKVAWFGLKRRGIENFYVSLLYPAYTIPRLYYDPSTPCTQTPPLPSS